MAIYNITLISTAHHENGKCNADELHKIIESISPEVIFEEMPISSFNMIYNGSQHPNESLESKCIKKYMQNHTVKHTPVDIDADPNLSNSNINWMFNTFKKYTAYNQLDDEQHLLTTQKGFAYLNSKECSELFNKKKTTEKTFIEFGFDNDLLIRIYKSFHEEQDNRENEMLRNIYNYSKENQYDQAVFLLGSGHRNSIMEKIPEYETNSKLKLNWTFYTSQNNL